MTRHRLMAILPIFSLIAAIGLAPVWGNDLNLNELRYQTPAPTGRIIIKFAEGSGLAVENGLLRPDAPDAPRVAALLRRAAAAFRLERHFSRDAAALDAERRAGQGRVGSRLPNLNRYARLTPLIPSDFSSREALLGILKALWADPAIETAFLEPRAVPAALGFDAFAGTFDAGAAFAGRLQERSPDYTPQQGYLDPAPDGVDAEGVWATAGGRGQSVKVLDIEGAWLWDHEDLPAPFFTAGGAIEDEGWRNHGTAVAGEIRAIGNLYGVTGISHEVQIGGVSIAELGTADAINTAAANLDPGDIFLIELHAPGPNATGQGQFGYVCMEFWQDVFDAILVASANGRICCEAAGNGQQDFDDAVYMGLFDRNVRDSGAIICGASNGGALEPAGFTNYGARVDLHGWGYSVCTTGYGNLQGGDEIEWYTDTFSGTSSASPIVTGSVASLQGMVKAAFGIPLNARLARDILVATGTPQEGTDHIGPRPNLTAAWAEAQNGIGAVAGTVTDAASGLPIPDVTVTALETGAFAVTGAGGVYSLPFQSGTYTLLFTSFFYASATEPVIITTGNTSIVDVALTAAPTIEIGGVVYADDAYTELENVRVTPIGVPLSGAVTGPDGRWSIPGFPEGNAYIFIFDNLPGYGVDAYWVGGPSLDPGLTRSDVEFAVQLPTA
ncbi:MAG: carboxypeptidase regulatory-like domain-containing protein, partial [Candidatus Eisenbacteria bacterium]|nr:carboxypeptidase regulatory-like domain-containing protein [Candidatus Eisenbacteria bacterium]